MTASAELALLRRLARLYGVQPGYHDAGRQLQQASAAAMLRAVQMLGAPIGRLAETADALRHRRQALWQQALSPVVVVWDGRGGSCELRLAADELSQAARYELLLETGEPTGRDFRPSELSTRRVTEIEGVRYFAQRLPLPERIPLGYHRLRVELARHAPESLVIAAPGTAYRAWLGAEQKCWGVFLPLYAMRTDRAWGCGDFSDLQTLIDWLAEQGGHLVATLPLFSSFAELSDDPSPYKPASRLFFNELYLDVTRLPELERSAEARRLLAAAETRQELSALRSAEWLDYRRAMALKRQVITAAAEAFFDPRFGTPAGFDQFLRDLPEVVDYARFRAAGERLGLDWRRWPQPLCDGSIGPDDCDQRAFHYHLYAQWQIEQQLCTLVSHAEARQMLWYLDLPLGASGDSYDVWRQRDCFCCEAAAGAPPDTFFTKGQNWGFPPLHPARSRAAGHGYFIAALRRQLRYARLLRLDHFMGIHRLYWVPQGHQSSDGVYVRYPAEDYYAILTLESHRHRAGIVGENLGTVPPVVNESMARRGILGMYVLQYETGADAEQPFRLPKPSEVAGINTHDMPPFAAYWRGLDIDVRRELGLIDAAEADRQHEHLSAVRQAVMAFLRRTGLLRGEACGPRDILQACLALLASSDAPVVLVNLEDLWEETQPQNTPGTFEQRPNWRRKARWGFEAFRQMPAVLEMLRTVAAGRSS